MAVNYSTLGTSVPNWQLLQTATPSGVATVTFSGLSGYNKYRIITANLLATGSNAYAMRFNGDSGANYHYDTGPENAGGTLTGAIALSSNQFSGFGNLNLTISSVLWLDIDHATLAIPKVVNGRALSFNSMSGWTGIYLTTSLLTSISLLATSSQNFNGGSIYLLGAN